jgi:hypothetical protein
MALPDHFEGEDVIITFEKEYISGDDTTRTTGIQNVGGKILSWNLSGGAQPTEDVYTFGNRTFNFQKPREKFSVSFEVVVNDPTFDFVQFGGVSGARIGDMGSKLVKSTDTTRDWRVILWFQDAGYHVSNSAKTIVVPAKTQSIYRMIFANVKSVSFDKDFSADDYFKGTLTMEFSSSDSNGYSNMILQEGIPYGAGTTSSPGTGTTSTMLNSMTTATAEANGTNGLLLEARGYLDWSATTTPAWYTGSTTTDVSMRYKYTG